MIPAVFGYVTGQVGESDGKSPLVRGLALSAVFVLGMSLVFAAIGAIAGNVRVGMGQFIARFGEESDGTVGVSETIIPGLSDHLVLPHSHMGMLFADDVAAQVAHFLRNGAFQKAA